MAQLRFQPIFFIQNFVIFSIKSVKFLAYAIGHILLAATILSIVTQSDIIFRSVVDGTFLQLLIGVVFVMVMLAMASGFIAASFNVLRTQMLATQVAMHRPLPSRRK